MKGKDRFREYLSDRDRFLELARFFVGRAAEDMRQEMEWEAKDTERAAVTMRTIQDALLEMNVDLIAAHSGSVSETTFLHSLQLSFLKNWEPLVLVTPLQDVTQQLSEFRDTLRNLDDFLRWHTEKYGGDQGIDEFLDEELRLGKMPSGERPYISWLIAGYHHLHLRQCFHAVLQPPFPNVQVEGRSIRPDMLFWIPSKEDVRIVVECDGFEYHVNKDTFVTDRKRDRVLRKAGFDVLRFAGSEIYHHPAESASELFDYLLSRKCHRTLKSGHEGTLQNRPLRAR